MNILDLKRKLLPMSGLYSGGGSSSTQTQTSGLPEWAMPYAKDTLAKQAALSDVPYQAYGADRIQGLTPMQETARQNAANMDAGPAGFSAGISAYMNPYQQNVTDIQKREAARQSGMQGVQQAGQATSAGALGGSRDAIMRAERERNLGQQMNDIQAQGSNAAFNQAAGQFRQGITQGIDVNRLQSAYGAQQQAMGQRGLDMAYQDFLNQKAYPQTQLSNMASMMRGLPIAQQTTTGTPGSPSTLQTLGGLAQIGYGLSGGGFFADGGEVSSYAGGGSVDSEQNVESIVHKLSDQQLDQADQAAKARGDAAQMQIIAMEKAARASMKRGIAAAPVDMDEMLPTEEGMARGGIVAFGFGGSAYGEGYEGEEEAQNYMSKEKDTDGGGDEAVGDPKDIAGSISALQKMKYTAPTAEEKAAQLKAYRAQMMEGVDTSDREGIRADIKRMQEEGDADLKRGRGLAFIQSGAAMLEGNDFARAAGKSASVFSQAYGDAIKANQAKKSALQNMKLNLAESQRKEQMGLNRDAIALQDQARKDEDAARRFEVDRLRALGVLQGAKARAERGTAVKPAAPPKVAEATLISTVNSRMAREKPLAGETPEQQRDRITAQEGPKILAQLGTRIGSMVSDVGGTRASLMSAGQDLEAVKAAEGLAQKNIDRLPITNKEYRTASPERKAEIVREIKNDARASFNLPPLGGGKAAPAAPAKAAPAKAAPASQIPAGATYGKVTPKGTEVFVGGKLVGYAN